MAESFKFSLSAIVFDESEDTKMKTNYEEELANIQKKYEKEDIRLKTNYEKELANIQEKYEEEVNKVKAKYAEMARKESLDDIIVNKLCAKPLQEQVLIALDLVQENSPTSRVWDGYEDEYYVFDNFFSLYLDTLIKKYRGIKQDSEPELREACKACFKQEAENIRSGQYDWITKDGDLTND